MPERPLAPYIPIAIALAVLFAFMEFRIWEWFDAFRVQLEQALHVGPFA